MKTFAKTLVVSALLMTGSAFAETEATTPEVVARQDFMKSFGHAAKALGQWPRASWPMMRPQPKQRVKP